MEDGQSLEGATIASEGLAGIPIFLDEGIAGCTWVHLGAPYRGALRTGCDARRSLWRLVWCSKRARSAIGAGS
jgi:hypothetical protein